jgi:hypothetical protein
VPLAFYLFLIAPLTIFLLRLQDTPEQLSTRKDILNKSGQMCD